MFQVRSLPSLLRRGWLRSRTALKIASQSRQCSSLSGLPQESPLRPFSAADFAETERWQPPPRETRLTEWERSLGEAEFARLREVQTECEVWRRRGYRMPAVLNEGHFAQLIGLDQDARILTLKQFGRLEKEAAHAKHMKHKFDLWLQRKLAKKAANPVDMDPDPVESGICPHLIPARGQKEQFFGARVVAARRLGHPNVVIDMSYLQQLSPKEQDIAIHFAKLAFEMNLAHRSPFALHLCGFNQGDKLVMARWQCERHFPSFEQRHHYLFGVSSGCYTETFPQRERLVYLTPDGETVLENFDSDKVYILGGVVDLIGDVSTVQRAKQQGIETARLPLEKDGVKLFGDDFELPFSQVFGLLLDLHLHDDWRKALLNNLPEKRLDEKQSRRAVDRKRRCIRRVYRMSNIIRDLEREEETHVAC